MQDAKPQMRDILPLYESIPLPDYSSPGDRPAVGKENDRAYELRRTILQQKLSTLKLTEALRMLHHQQIDAGFVKDDLSQVKYFQCYDYEKVAFFIGQYNPRRRERRKGAGRDVAPRGSATKRCVDLTCFLCADNVRWQQSGVQLYYQFSVNNRSYNALCNPFPFGPVHTTVATVAHDPQSWRETTTSDKKSKVTQIIQDLCEIAIQLPEFVGFYNGVGAGATIEKHFHYHFFEVPPGQQAFPLQQAANRTESEMRSRLSGRTDFHRLKVKDTFYPLTAFRLVGDREQIASNTVDLVLKWDALAGEYASANLIALTEGGNTVIYVIPRNRFYARSPGMGGIVGGLEALGEFVFCTESEDQAINQQNVDYSYMWRILESVNPPSAHVLHL
jgi:diadenosine tetraphosphate (Ap4A) HIT family hydrolase